MTKHLVRCALATCLLTAGYLAGTLSPHARADAADELVREARAIRAELTGIRRALEKR